MSSRTPSSDEHPDRTDPSDASAPSRTLLPHHQELIARSGISPETAFARGYRSATKKKDLKVLGFTDSQCHVPALVLPVLTVHGEVGLHQIRPDAPRCAADGKPVKYETPRGARMTIDVPPAARPDLRDPTKPLLVTEGVRKADSAVTRGLCCVALLGVWSWRGNNGMGGLTALADWESIALKGRQVFIVFDSDVTTKSTVRGALVRLVAFLTKRGAHVEVLLLPTGEGGSKVGLDDYLATGRSVDDLLRLQRLNLDDRGSGVSDTRYLARDGALVLLKDTKDGVVEVPLTTNFVAEIVGDVNEDDGVERRRLFEIAATVGGRRMTFRIPAADFAGMNWVPQHLGPAAIVSAGLGSKDHARAAIQTLSGIPVERRVFTHTGWTEIDGAWVFLHAGGAIGARGAVEGIEVRLDPPLDGFRLPDPQADMVAADVGAILRLLDLGPLDVMAPVFAVPWRAVIAPSDITVHMQGTTGLFKTEVVSLIQRHFGIGMDADHLPAAWSGTANSLEVIAFLAKDVVLVVDDFVPDSDPMRFHRDAARLLRAKGNLAGRSRLRADATLRLAKPPRALILSTGEDTPRGHSLRARIVIVEMAKGTIDPERLTKCQLDAAGGAYARVMAWFVRRFASRRAEFLATLDARLRDLRSKIRDERFHRRTPDAVAHLFLGIEVFFELAVAEGAISAEDAKKRVEDCYAALLRVAEAQGEHHAAADVVERFVTVLRAAFTSGAAHVCAPDGSAPPAPGRWGWTASEQHRAPAARGDCVGWVEGDRVYLEFQAAFQVVARAAIDTGDPIGVTPLSLKKRLAERAFIEPAQRGGQRHLEVRRMLQGVRRSVVALRAEVVFPDPFDAQPDGQDGQHGQLPSAKDRGGERASCADGSGQTTSTTVAFNSAGIGSPTNGSCPSGPTCPQPAGAPSAGPEAAAAADEEWVP